MGDFPTLGSEGKSESKKEPSQMTSKSDQASIGTFGSSAAQPRSEEQKAGGISFGKAPPKFSRKEPKKNVGENTADLGK